MVPFRRKDYYLPEMKGSYSIKYVLPAMVPEMNYEELTIQNGEQASSAFYNLKNITPVVRAYRCTVQVCTSMPRLSTT